MIHSCVIGGGVIGCKKVLCSGDSVGGCCGVSSAAWCRGSRGDHGGGECGLVPDAYRPGVRLVLLTLHEVGVSSCGQ